MSTINIICNYYIWLLTIPEASPSLLSASDIRSEVLVSFGDTSPLPSRILPCNCKKKFVINKRVLTGYFLTFSGQRKPIIIKKKSFIVFTFSSFTLVFISSVCTCNSSLVVLSTNPEAKGTASEPDNLRGRPLFLLGPK